MWKIHRGDTSVVLEISAALHMRELLLGGFRCIVTDHLETRLCLKLIQRLFMKKLPNKYVLNTS